MGITNLIFLVTGVFLIIFGFTAMFYPNLARWINAIGVQSPTLKALICIPTGIILVIVSVTVTLSV